MSQLMDGYLFTTRRLICCGLAVALVASPAYSGQVGPEIGLPTLAKQEAKRDAAQVDADAAATKQKQANDEAALGGANQKQTGDRLTFAQMWEWAKNHGPTTEDILRIVGILVATLAVYVVIQRSGKHLVKVVARGGRRGSVRERENRAVTLVGVFQNIASLVVLGGGALMVLEQLGISIVPLMGGAAVLGLAVAFGSQNLIKDYFSGFMVLLEDQYGVNDVVKIGDISGAVEQITLRMTVLRDLEGTAHFIPHGTITTVSNMTHTWSRAN